ncbi:MAG: hypothetical protein KAX20_07035 [Candidatus Omnitrophica bacterium]|nr:hypothetical protein [Candidatus Omnitrophota bacterium]
MNRRDFLNFLSNKHEGNFKGALPLLLILFSLVVLLCGGWWYWGNSIKLQESEVKVARLEVQVLILNISRRNTWYVCQEIGRQLQGDGTPLSGTLILEPKLDSLLRVRTEDVFLDLHGCQYVARELILTWWKSYTGGD